MRASTLFIIAKIFGQENRNLFINNLDFSREEREKHLKSYITKTNYSRSLDRRSEIYGSKRRNTTRR